MSAKIDKPDFPALIPQQMPLRFTGIDRFWAGDQQKIGEIMAGLKMDITYDANSPMQKRWGDVLSEFLWPAMSSYTDQSSVTMADFGAATGLNSCKTFKPLLERFRAASSASVWLYHTDRPENHWSTLFSNLVSHADSYRSVSNVHSFAIGQSFYTKLFPDNSLDIGYACSAFHWLAQPYPTNLLISSRTLSFESSPQVLAHHQENLATILRLRQSELKPGGHLIFNLPDGTNQAPSVFHAPIEVASEMKAEGLIPDGYLEHFPIPVTRFSAETNLAVIRSLGTYEVVNTKVLTDDFILYKQYKETGDLETYVKRFAGFTRAYLYPYLKGMCTKGEEGEALIQLFFTKLEEKVRSNPEPLTMTQSFFHLKKLSN